MKWFSGPIQDAIATAKQDQKIFLVVVEGADETSNNMDKIIMEDDISTPVDQNCVSIKLTTDSESFRQFSQIYPVLVVPSMFFIGNNGIPLEVIAGSENKEEIMSKIDKAIQLHKTGPSSSSASAPTVDAAPTVTPKTTESALAPQPEESASSLSDKTEDTESDSQEKQLLPDTSETASEPANESVLSEDEAMVQELLRQKVERAEQLMAERRKLREKEEKEKEREKELEQRRVSRELQKAREQIKEKELADWAKQRQREKQEDKAARDRVLAQIAQDRADRAAKQQYPEASGSSGQATTSVRQRTTTQDSASNNEVCRIQFRLPNSMTATHEFPSGSTLQDVMRHVDQVVKPGLSSFTLATSFPRRHFVKTDYSRTLLELELVPSAVLLVLPTSAVRPVNQGSSGGLWMFIWTILSPLTLLWNFVYSFIFGGGAQRNTTPQEGESSPAPAPNPHNKQQTPGPSTSKSPSNKTPDKQNASRYRKDGNIHRLSNESSNDDEDGTWNGNSTQQM